MQFPRLAPAARLTGRHPRDKLNAMPDIDWKLVLAKHFDKPIQKTGRHAYRLIHPITIRVDETDISLPKGSLFVFEQEGVAVVRESVQSAEKYNIALKSISLVTVE